MLGPTTMSATATPRVIDHDSREWVRELRAGGATGEAAVTRLRALLLRAAAFEVARRNAAAPHGHSDTDAVVARAADDALALVRARLDDFRGDSRFTTWAAKFAVLEAAVAVRRRAWAGRELPTARAAIAGEQPELARALARGIDDLPAQQRDVLVALALQQVPIDVLAERLGTTRAALYATLQEARAALRRRLGAVDAPA
jgi:RNA polymerase sigma-70 factor (ECF subfamily)